MTKPRRWTGHALVRAILLRDGRIEAFDAVYHLTDPDGRPHRITRLADNIWKLRTKEGWVIDTVDEPGKLAVYVLRSVPESTEADHIPSITPATASIEVPMTDEGAKVIAADAERIEEMTRAGLASQARREAAAAPYCPVKGCEEKLQQVVPTLAPGWVSGRCIKHGVKTAKAA